MIRDLNRMAGRGFDVLVIGAGIYGAWAAWDAALRGLTVAVIDKDDFGGATSANNLRVVHGGLRYLQHLDLNRMRESIREQRILLRVAPHLVHPLPCAVPTYGRGARGRMALRAALILNDLVGWNRNWKAAPGKTLPRGYLIGAHRMKEALPGIPDRGLTGGAVWHDAQVRDPERLVLAILESASRQGAAVANHVSADALLEERGRVVGARVTDGLSGESFFIRAGVTLNLTGPWSDSLLRTTYPGLVPTLFPYSHAWNLVVRRRLVSDIAVGLYSSRTFKDADRKMSRGTRLLFLTPWRDVTLVGTSHRPFKAEGRGLEMGHDAEEISDLLEEVSGAYPAAELGPEDVSYAFGGLLPGNADPSTGDVRLLKHPVIRDHGQADGIQGLITGVGVKFTTARRVAERLVDMAARQYSGRADACRTHVTPLVSGDIRDWPEFSSSALSHRILTVPPITLSRLVENHGTRFREVLGLAGEEGPLLNLLADGCPVLQAEVVYAAREEMAMTLMDVVRRRTEIGKFGLKNREALTRAAALQAGELGWDGARREVEIRDVLEAYRPFLGRGTSTDVMQ